MLEFTAMRKQLQEAIGELSEHTSIAHSRIPPNILILRRITVRQFPGDTMVALYKNDRLGLTFSIPYGTGINPVITPAPLEEGFKAHHDIDGMQRASWMDKFEKHVVKTKPEHAGKIDWDTASYLHGAGHKPEAAATLYHTRRLDLKEGAIDRLRHIKDFHAVNHVQHDDGTRTTVDPTTAHALLTVHDALHPDNQEKFARHLEHSKGKFARMVDFSWKNVK